MQKVSALDRRFMARALALAARGGTRVHPNPRVGAVLAKNGRVIGEGAHRVFGGAHAEVIAARAAGSSEKSRRALSGSTLYVTLEPCSHFGKTPPCADLLIGLGVRRVVYATADPNPRVSGRGLSRLRRAGVRVEHGPFTAEARELNREYFHWVKTGRPYVTVKVAQSLDGRIATRTGHSRWITGPRARAYGRRLRAESDAVMVGVNTVLSDDPRLSSRLSGEPLRVIVDSRLRTPARARCLNGPALIATTSHAPQARRRALSSKAELLIVRSRGTRVDLRDLLTKLGQRGVTSLLIEGGGELIASALEQKLVQEAYFFIAPKLIGGRAAVPSVGGLGPDRVDRCRGFQHVCSRWVGSDLLIHGSF